MPLQDQIQRLLRNLYGLTDEAIHFVEEVTDAEIDRSIYQLYGLTDDEIAIVEEATKT